MFREWLSRLIHVSWVLAWFGGSLIIGIALIPNLRIFEFASTEWPILAVALLAVALINRTAKAVLLAVVAGLIIGFWRGSVERLATIDYTNFIGQTLQIRGVVADDVTHKDATNGVKLKDVSIEEHKVGGEAWIGTMSTASANLKRSDDVIFAGKLNPGFGNFAASMSFAQQIYYKHNASADPSRNIRDKFEQGLRRAVNEPAATLGIGYLVGQHNDLPTTLEKQLRLVGLIHLVIAGGYNVTILVRFARRFFGRMSKYLGAVSAIFILGLLTLVSGFSAPISRTAIVTGLSLAAWYWGRRIHPMVLLPISAAITALINPTFVWGDAGWYLTFVAYGGLIVLGPMLHKYFWGDKQPNVLRQIMVDSLAVQIVTMPLMAFAFQQYSIYGLPANLLVLPLMPVTLLCIFVAGLAGVFVPALAHWVGLPANALLNYTNLVTTHLAAAPGADVTATFGVIELIAAYGVIVGVIYVLWRKTKFNFRQQNIVE